MRCKFLCSTWRACCRKCPRTRSLHHLSPLMSAWCKWRAWLQPAGRCGPRTLSGMWLRKQTQAHTCSVWSSFWATLDWPARCLLCRSREARSHPGLCFFRRIARLTPYCWGCRDHWNAGRLAFEQALLVGCPWYTIFSPSWSVLAQQRYSLESYKTLCWSWAVRSTWTYC